MRWLVRLTTVRGVFWWDPSAMWEREQAFSPMRLWGWVEGATQAQRYKTQGNALRAGRTLYAELARLYPVRIDVVGGEVTTLGVRVVEEEVVVVGDCRGEVGSAA